MSALVLNCWILGDYNGNTFKVEVSAECYVPTLKAVIKEEIKVGFQHIDASDLVLYPVSVAFDDSYEENIEKLDLTRLKPLPAHMKLSSCFANHMEDYLDVIIEVPSGYRFHPLLELNCLVLGDSMHRIFSVNILGTKTVDELKVAIKKENENRFQHIDAVTLVLWQVSIPVDDDFDEQLRKIDFMDEKSLPSVKRLGQLFSDPVMEESVHIIVKPPPERLRKEWELLEQIRGLVGDVANLTIHVREFHRWSDDDIRHPKNDIDLRFNFHGSQPDLSGDTNHPEFVARFLNNLKKKRKLSFRDREQYGELETRLGRKFSEFFEQVSENANVDEREIRAYIAAMVDCAPNVSIVNKKSAFFKRSHFTVFIVDPVFQTLEGYDKGIMVKPAMIVREINQGQNTEPRIYSPNMNSAFVTPYGPTVIHQTISADGQTDRNRLLLQATVYVRVGNELRKDDRDLIILCFYVNKYFEAERYIVYQPPSHDSRRVGIIHDRVFKLSDPLHCFEFLFELFNYLDIHRTVMDGFDPDKRTSVNTVSDLLKQIPDLFLSSKSRNHSSSTQSSRDISTASSTDDSGIGILNTIYEHEASLRQHGYRIIGMLKYHPQLAVAESKSHEQHIVKVVDKSKEEWDIIEYLVSPKVISDPRNHVIPVKAIIETDNPANCVIVMPKMRQFLELLLDIGLKGPYADELMRQIVEGFSFLHEHGIAHLDIKPSNIVIDAFAKRVHIIDFDLARRVDSAEDTMSGYVGTEDWTAPEVQVKSTYSAIRADLWAVGRLFQYCVALWRPTNEVRLSELCEMLLEEDPLKRPMLKDILSEFHHMAM